MRLMGRKSEMLSAPSFLGNKAIEAVLTTWKLLTVSSEKSLMTRMRSSLMISQQERRKFEVKPSGTGALSGGKSSNGLDLILREGQPQAV